MEFDTFFVTKLVMHIVLNKKQAYKQKQAQIKQKSRNTGRLSFSKFEKTVFPRKFLLKLETKYTQNTHMVGRI